MNKHLEIWNQAILDTFFSPKMRGRFVYLDLDESMQDSLCNHPSLPSDSKIEDLVKAVRQEILLTGTTDFMLQSFVIETRHWYAQAIKTKNFSAAPPMLGFLVLAVMAAERMGEGEYSGNAYYSHLHRILNIPRGRQRTNFENAFRKYSNILWGSLNSWLANQDGLRGLPTAYALGEKYVGIPISQALIRSNDRAKLPAFFQHFNLMPGEYVNPEDMELLLDGWVTKSFGSASAGLKSLWARQGSRVKIAELVSEELKTWTGSIGERSSSAQGPRSGNQNTAERTETAGELTPVNAKIKLTLRIFNRMGRKSLKFNLSIPATPSELLVRQKYFLIGSEHALDVERGGEHDFRLLSPEVFLLEDILSANLELKSSKSEVLLKRLPKRLVVLAFDENTQDFKETDRIGYGQDLLVLAKADENFDIETAAFLTLHARPGFKSSSDQSLGVPSGWALFENVQIVQIPDTRDQDKAQKFGQLFPQNSSSLHLAGGLRLPSFRSQVKWLTKYPPEIRAVSQTSPKIRVEVSYLNPTSDKEHEALASFSSDNGLIVQPLGGLGLEDGEYQIILFDKKGPVQSRQMFLRSGHTPDLASRQNAPKLAHSPSLQGPLFVFGSTITEKYEGSVVGGFCDAGKSTFEVMSLPDQVSFYWPESHLNHEVEAPRNPIRLAHIRDASCVYVGNHKVNLETGKPGQKTVLGVCAQCGRVTIEVNDPREAERRKTQREQISQTRVEHKPVPIRDEDVTPRVDWSDMLSILAHCVGGTYSSLLNAIEHLESQTLTGKEMLENLEMVGVIEVQRSESGIPSLWRLTDTQLVRPYSTSTLAFIIGYVSPRQLKTIVDECKVLEVSVTLAKSSPAIAIHSADEELLASIAQKLNCSFVPDASVKLANSLPPLSEVVHAMAKTTLPSADSVSRFNLESGNWEQVEGLPSGAIRIDFGSRRAFFYVNSELLGQGLGISASATTVKYLAANSSLIPLTKIRDRDESILVPLGARVPGLYGRVLALCSGSPERKITSNATGKSMHKYANVPREIAELIARLLIS